MKAGTEDHYRLIFYLSFMGIFLFDDIMVWDNITYRK